ncbi:hypothetical protein HanPSC8_Chr05g0203161 [Helianthus annuus]|nr:hypothetical protein HanPSC8_Chr05g0203161 [Helianthus annuus]
MSETVHSDTDLSFAKSIIIPSQLQIGGSSVIKVSCSGAVEFDGISIKPNCLLEIFCFKSSITLFNQIWFRKISITTTIPSKSHQWQKRFVGSG